MHFLTSLVRSVFDLEVSSNLLKSGFRCSVGAFSERGENRAGSESEQLPHFILTVIMFFLILLHFVEQVKLFLCIHHNHHSPFCFLRSRYP